MQQLWNEELSAEKQDEMIEKLAREIVNRRMQSPAILALELHKPIAGFLSQTSLVLSPFMIPFLGFNGVNQYSQLFSKRANWDRLIEKIEEKSVSTNDPSEPQELQN